MSRIFKYSLSVISVFAFVALVAYNGKQIAEASCFIGWDVNNTTTCEVATNSDGDYSYNVTTQFASFNKGTWTLNQFISLSSGNNVTNVSVNPSSTTITESGSPPHSSGTISTACAGSLVDNLSQGTSQLNAYSSPIECSGSWSTVIKPNGGSCP